MILHPRGNVLKEYWETYAGVSRYRVHLEESDTLKASIVTRNGGRAVGTILRFKSGGVLVALPWIDFHAPEFFTDERDEEDDEISIEDYDEEEWSPEGIVWGKKYLRVLESLEQALRGQREATPEPQWALDDRYRTKKETALSEQLLGITSEIYRLEKMQRAVREQLQDAGCLRQLLFEQGHRLEGAVLNAMRLMGFKANNYRSSDSEFDAVLECAEGRCIGEAEGRDRKAISIDKMRQLEVNIHEDFAREEVFQPAKGILFGNAFRLSSPGDRPAEHFTAKCMTAAKRNGTALVRTCDLFEVARVLENVRDPGFAASCRAAIFGTSGGVVEFPTIEFAEQR